MTHRIEALLAGVADVLHLEVLSFNVGLEVARADKALATPFALVLYVKVHEFYVVSEACLGSEWLPLLLQSFLQILHLWVLPRWTESMRLFRTPF